MMFNKLSYIFLLALAFVSCQDGNDFGDDFSASLEGVSSPQFVAEYIRTSESSVSFDASGGSNTVTIESNTNWTISIKFSDEVLPTTRVSDSWLTAETSSDGKTLTITASENTSYTERTAYVLLSGSSSSVTINVTQTARTTYPDYFYEIGYESGWSTAHKLYSPNGDGKYVGYYYLTGEFKFLSNANGLEDNLTIVKVDGLQGTLIWNGNNNCPDPGAGFYQIELDLPNMTYRLTRIETISLIGSFSDWEGDCFLTYNQAQGCWEGTVTVTDCNLKFRANSDWELNWGGPEDNLVINGDNIVLSAGTYTIQLYLSYEGNNKVVITKQDEENDRLFTVVGNGKTVTFTMKLVKAGTFQMGSSAGYSNEQPVHPVTLTDNYYMGETEVTQALWYAVMGQSPTTSGSKWESTQGLGDNHPAYYISYNNCQAFITALNTKLADQLQSGEAFRMPTEAEWEYAARGGSKSQGYTYAGGNTIGDVAWYTTNSNSSTHTVKTKAANELGLYDMSGNVWEWCADWYGANYYSTSPTNDPTGPSTGSNRVLRGGSWNNNATYCRTTYRNYYTPTLRGSSLGLRLALK